MTANVCFKSDGRRELMDTEVVFTSTQETSTPMTFQRINEVQNTNRRQVTNNKPPVNRADSPAGYLVSGALVSLELLSGPVRQVFPVSLVRYQSNGPQNLSVDAQNPLSLQELTQMNRLNKPVR